MASDMFLKIDNVEGEAQDKHGHGGEIEVISWGWNLFNTGSAHRGVGAGTGKVDIKDLEFTKYLDKSTPTLIKALCTGTHFNKAVLTVRKAGGEKPLEYLKIILEGLIVSSYTTGRLANEEVITETVGLNFTKFTVEYTPQDAKGNAAGKAECNYIIPANK